MIKTIENEFEKHGIDVDNKASILFAYYELLIEWNKQMNLTAITDYKDVVTKHFVDSCLPLKYELIHDGYKCIDVGTGAGFPGIPLAILNPDTEFTLLDSRNKRVMFLENVIRELNLRNCTAVYGRAEEMAHSNQNREAYDIALTRAVSDISTVMEYTIPFIRVGGKSIAYRGKDFDDIDIEAIKCLGVSSYVVKNECIDNMERNIVIVYKDSVTDIKYPRKENAIRNKPLIKQ